MARDDGRAPPGTQAPARGGLALTLDGEAIITMKDVCRLENDETLAVLRSAAGVLLRAALQEVPRFHSRRQAEQT
jgi:hypothetical protein